MKNIRYVVLTGGIIIFGIGTQAQEAKITVHVTGENGAPISNAQAGIGFMTAIKPGEGWGTGGENAVRLITDSNGYCSASGITSAGSVGLSVWKDGYYGNGGQSVTLKDYNTASHRWEPWNPTIEVILKKKGIQIPMYAKKVNEIKIPELGKKLGFDLMAGDWVAPYGQGRDSDFVIKIDSKPEPKVPPREIPPFDVTLAVDFPNNGDGIQSIFAPRRTSSTLRLPRRAPSDGYEANLLKRKHKERGGPIHSDFRDDQNYFFRVRTKKDPQGNIVSALYGIISGDFFVGGRNDDELTFVYFLNPEPNSRNMEFNPHQNLFKNLSPLEKVDYH